MDAFDISWKKLRKKQDKLLAKVNRPEKLDTGIFRRWKRPIIIASHVPFHWIYTLIKTTNPFLLERIGINATFNSGALQWKGKYIKQECVRKWRDV